jgi:murein L,D-transpeptidase YafK
MLESIKMLQHTNLLKELYCNTLQTTAQILTPLERARENKVMNKNKNKKHAYQNIYILRAKKKEQKLEYLSNYIENVAKTTK